jgi:LPXTG-motif cell wall-anchored protein
MDREPNVYNRETNVYDNTGRGSNTLAYVIGGLVIALGLLAFLFYDGGSNEPCTTGSTGTQTETTAPRTSSGATGGSSTAPATPTTPAPAAPATPAPQQ